LKKLITFLLILNSFVYANLEDVQEKCANEYSKNSDIIKDYYFRMEDDINEIGCKVIPIYASIIESDNLDLLYLIEENKSILDQLLELFYANSYFSELIFKNSQFKQLIINNALNKNTISNLIFLAKNYMYRSDIAKIKRDKEYINYYMISSFYANNHSEATKLYKKLKKSIPLDLLSSFILVLNAVNNEYSFNELLESFNNIFQNLSKDDIKKLTQYPQYFAYFLYPKKDDFNIDTISNDRLKDLQKSIQKKALFVYKSMYRKYKYEKGMNQVTYALLSLEYIYPYLIEQYSVNYDDFAYVFNMLVENGYIKSLFIEDICSDNSKINFAVFGNGNIKSIVKLFKKESYFANNLLKNLNRDSTAVFYLFYVANFYNNSTKEEWYVFKELLKTLPYSYKYRIAFLKRLEKANFFRNIINESDYKQKVYTKDMDSYPKFAYILVTPFPAKDDKTIFEKILENKISDEKLKQELLEIMQKDTEELAKHNFTTFDKFMVGAEYIDNIDTAITVAAIVVAPFTGGVSLSAIAVKFGAKKGIKQMIYNEGKKLVEKGIKKAKLAKDRLVKKIDTKKLEKKIDSFGNSNDNLQLTILGSNLFLLSKSPSNIKQICKE